MSEQVEVHVEDDGLYVHVGDLDDDPDFRIIHLRPEWHAAVLRALVEQAGGVEVTVFHEPDITGIYRDDRREVDEGKYLLLPLEAPE